MLGNGREFFPHGLVVGARQNQGQEDVVLEGEGVQQVEVLEHEPRWSRRNAEISFSCRVTMSRMFRNTWPLVACPAPPEC